MLLPLKEFRSLDFVKDQMQRRLQGSRQGRFAAKHVEPPFLPCDLGTLLEENLYHVQYRKGSVINTKGVLCV